MPEQPLVELIHLVVTMVEALRHRSELVPIHIVHTPPKIRSASVIRNRTFLSREGSPVSDYCQEGVIRAKANLAIKNPPT